MKDFLAQKVLKTVKEACHLEKLIKLGGSYALILPRYWAEEFCLISPDENGNPTYWVEVETGVEGGKAYTRIGHPDEDEILRVVKQLPTMPRGLNDPALAFSDEQIIELCKSMLKPRGIKWPVNEKETNEIS